MTNWKDTVEQHPVIVVVGAAVITAVASWGLSSQLQVAPRDEELSKLRPLTRLLAESETRRAELIRQHAKYEQSLQQQLQERNEATARDLAEKDKLLLRAESDRLKDLEAMRRESDAALARINAALEEKVLELERLNGELREARDLVHLANARVAERDTTVRSRDLTIERCHRSLQNRPRMVTSKPATSKPNPFYFLDGALATARLRSR